VKENGKDLLPDLKKQNDVVAPESRVSRISAINVSTPQRPTHVVDMRNQRKDAARNKPVRASGKTMRRALKIGTALTFVIVISYGLSTLKTESRYTFNSRAVGAQISQTASALISSDALDRLAAYVESLLAPQLTYIRK
jgi:hypothetical protein